MDLWDIVLIVATVLLVIFALAIAFGAPYLPTLRPQVDTMFDLLDLKPGQTFIELGSGDGRVLKAAAERGFKAIGIEVNPLLAIYSRLATWNQRDKVTVVWGSAWSKPLPEGDAVFVFLLQPFMSKVDRKMKAEGKGLKLASYTFEIPRKKPIRSKNGINLYQY